MKTLQTLSTHPSIKAALIYLANRCDGACSLDSQGLNKVDSSFGHDLARQADRLSFNQQIAALKMLRKYRKQLKNGGITLPTNDELNLYLRGEEKNHLQVEQVAQDEFIVTNPCKGTQYSVTTLNAGSEVLYQCDCPIPGNCKHIDAVKAQFQVEPEYTPQIEEVTSEPLLEPEWLTLPEEEPELAPNAREESAIVFQAEESDWIDIDEEPQAYEQILEGIDLTLGQQQALKELAAFVSGGEKFHLLTGWAGVGKAQPLEESILTPNGWRKMGEIKSKDYVISQDGTPTQVLAVFPKVNLQIYRVHFDDGSWTECCIDHLWKVYTPKRKYAVLPLSSMLPLINQGSQVNKNGKKSGYAYSVDLCDPIHFQERPVPLHPYLMGWLLGDGYLPSDRGNVHIATWVEDSLEIKNLLDQYLPSDVQSSLYEPCPSSPNVKKYALTVAIKKYLEQAKVLGLKSSQKFVPEDYLHNSIECRKFILAGLLDTDGCVTRYNDESVVVRYASTSKQLALDVIELVRSLGGRASFWKQDRGIKDDAYHVSVRLSFNPFILSRKQSLYGDYCPHRAFRKKIIKAEYVGMQDGQCILVDHPSHLYLTRDYTVTHNTTVLQAFVKLLRAYHDNRPIAFVSPTNKATKVLAQMVSRWNLNIDCMTCHKLLGLRPHKVEKKIEFRPDPKEEPTFNQYDLIVVDEVSMLNESMWYLLNNACQLNQKLLFVGDEYQAPPVNEARSLAFVQIPEVSRLIEIVRYSGAVGDAVEQIRSTIDSAFAQIPQLETVDEGEKGVYVIDRKAWEIQLIRHFTSDEYKLNPDYVRAIAYTNKRVNQLNTKIREKVYGIEAEQFMAGERLIAQEAYSQNETVIIPTSEEASILNAVKGAIGQWDVWYLQVKLDDGTINTVPVLQEEAQTGFEKRLNELAANKRWFEYWGLRETFADLRYPFAITSHKSQGSTYQNVFIDIGNFTNTYGYILKNCKAAEERENKLRERNRLLYTAASRASHKLFICY